MPQSLYQGLPLLTNSCVPQANKQLVCLSLGHVISIQHGDQQCVVQLEDVTTLVLNGTLKHLAMPSWRQPHEAGVTDLPYCPDHFSWKGKREARKELPSSAKTKMLPRNCVNQPHQRHRFAGLLGLIIAPATGATAPIVGHHQLRC